MKLNETFDTNAAQYEKSRPKYPKILFDIINSYIHLDESNNVLEIGCGTGQATELFVNTKAKIHCIDIGESLLNVCRNKYSDQKNISFEANKYETFNSTSKYDLIFSATAYHWINQPEGDQKTKELLNKNGIFALFRNYHIKINDGFFLESQVIYDKYMGKNEVNEINDYRIMNKNAFSVLSTFEYYWNEKYEINEYLNLLSTYSDHIALSKENRCGLFDELRKLAVNKYDGVIEKKNILQLEIGKNR
jgi:cyclopropane fatty-acyl-phospholipid synthase-like methyltransferase